MGDTRRVIELYDYQSVGGEYLGKKTVAWCEHRLIVSRVEWIEPGVSVRLINRPGGVDTKAVPSLPAERPWGEPSYHTPLWVSLGDVE